MGWGFHGSKAKAVVQVTHLVTVVILYVKQPLLSVFVRGNAKECVSKYREKIVLPKIYSIPKYKQTSFLGDILPFLQAFSDQHVTLAPFMLPWHILMSGDRLGGYYNPIFRAYTFNKYV